VIRRYKYLRVYSELSYNSYCQLSDYPFINTLYPSRPKNFNRSSTKNSRLIKFNYDIRSLYSGLGVILQDSYLENHSNHVSDYCLKLGKALGLRGKVLQDLELAGMLHDIGKAYIPKDIINKTGKLNDQEWKIVRTHPRIGYNILSTVEEYSNLAEYALYHHERIDGKGYPEGLKGEQIPFPSRIIAVVDAYEAMTEDRPYRKALSQAEAIAELRKYSNQQFDKDIVDVFIEKVLKTL